MCLDFIDLTHVRGKDRNTFEIFHLLFGRFEAKKNYFSDVNTDLYQKLSLMIPYP